MCDFQVLAQNINGYVVFCPDCVAIQLAFGTAMIKAQVSHYEEIVHIVKLEVAERDPSEDPCLKNIVIPLGDGMMMCLTHHELLKLEQLLNEANAMFETYKILQRI